MASGWAGGTVVDDTIFIASMQGKLVALNVADGSSRGDPVALEIPPATGGFGCLPSACAQQGATAVAIYGSPAMGGDLVYVGGYNDGKIRAFLFEEGRLRQEPRWVYPREGSAGGSIVGGLVVSHDRVYFGSADEKDEKDFEAFMKTCAETMDRAVKEHGVQPVIVAMEALDENACRELMKHMESKAILISCNEFVGVQIGAILRVLSMLVTTRYHAMVLSMPGLVPFVGLSRDERIMGVMKETGLYDDYYVDYRTSDLGGVLMKKIKSIMDDKKESGRIRGVIEENLPYYYAQMGLLGLDIRDLVRESIVKKEWISNKQVSGIISMVYNHHQRELVDKLLDVQHDYQDSIISTQHIHLDHHNCLEVIVAKGKAKDIQKIADRLKSVRGVKHVNINMATVGKDLV